MNIIILQTSPDPIGRKCSCRRDYRRLSSTRRGQRILFPPRIPTQVMRTRHDPEQDTKNKPHGEAFEILKELIIRIKFLLGIKET